MNVKLQKMNCENVMKTVKVYDEAYEYRKRSGGNCLTKNDSTEALQVLVKWLDEGDVYNIIGHGELIGYIYIEYLSIEQAVLKDIYIIEKYHGKRICKNAMRELDEALKRLGIQYLTADIVPKNKYVLKFYQDCGFEQVEFIQLKRNIMEEIKNDDVVYIDGCQFQRS
ncbi:GNAT family N-acetyltransferase [Vallitalea okinawensis]|uniref:GNAT family N-acetyltransferase n=1 Tax=Vallitalea okinawensis TaxID=2078660 RepID=UPI000CFCDF21|nr:GNAT family N-acetyltransferase [Vallitalea okinawensis]